MMSFRACPALLLLLTLCTATMQAQQHADICYFGDSITEGWIEAQLRSERAYPSLTDSLLRSHGRSFTSINLGRGGETSEDALRRIDSDVLSRTPRIVIIAFGSNDWFVWGNPPFQRVPLDRYLANLDIMFRKIQGVGAIPVLLGLPPVIGGRFYSFSDSTLYSTYGGVEEINRRYSDGAEALAQRRGVIFLRSLRDHGTDSLLGFDGVHPLTAGHNTLAHALAPVLEPLLDSTTVLPAASSVMLYPVPFQRLLHPRLMLSVATPAGTAVSVGIHDAAGREVRKFVYFAWSEGTQYLHWDGTAGDGTPVAAGAYTVFVLSGDNLSHHSLLIL